jgi:hypothetical protein
MRHRFGVRAVERNVQDQGSAHSRPRRRVYHAAQHYTRGRRWRVVFRQRAIPRRRA